MYLLDCPFVRIRGMRRAEWRSGRARITCGARAGLARESRMGSDCHASDKRSYDTIGVAVGTVRRLV